MSRPVFSWKLPWWARIELRRHAELVRGDLQDLGQDDSTRNVARYIMENLGSRLPVTSVTNQTVANAVWKHGFYTVRRYVEEIVD